MRRMMLWSLVVAASPLSVAATGPLDPRTGVPTWETINRHCDYVEDMENGMTYQGPCEEYQNYKTGEQSVSFEGRKFRIEEYRPPRRNPPWFLFRINGQPVIAYSPHRSWMSYTTLDLKRTLDVCGEASLSGGCQ